MGLGRQTDVDNGVVLFVCRHDRAASALDEQATAGRACAILALVGVVNLPIIKYSVSQWFTLHQPASFSLTEKPMPTEMWMPLLFMVVAYYLFFITALLSRLRSGIWTEKEIPTGLESGWLPNEI